MLLDPASLPTVTINFEYGDTDHEMCRSNPLRLYKEFTAPGADYAGYGILEVNVSVLSIPDDIERDWWATPDSYWMRQKVRRALKLGYEFSPFEFNDYLDDLFEINTSKDARQGRQMGEWYRRRPDERDPFPEQPCARHHFGYFGVFNGGTLRAYTLVARAGEMMQFSQILGHGGYLEDGIMNLLIFEAVKWHQERTRTPYAVYYRQDSGTTGLKFFKRKMGFVGHLVRWELARPEVDTSAVDLPATNDQSPGVIGAAADQSSRDWRIGAEGSRAAGAKEIPRIQGYSSRTSVPLGGAIEFYVDVPSSEDFFVSVYRVGPHDPTGAQHAIDSPKLKGVSQSPVRFDESTGQVDCGWSASWRLEIPTEWRSGLYIAVFTTSSGWRSYAPFVVRDEAPLAALCVVVPFLTYQANNRWPLDGVHGKSLAAGYRDGTTTYKARACEVSFDRPFDRNGLPLATRLDIDVIGWLEATGHELTYASDVDLHEGHLAPSRFAGLVFCGQHEYWTKPMRDFVKLAMRGGTSFAFLGSSSGYWHARLTSVTDGDPARSMACYKSQPDAARGNAAATSTWRAAKPGPAEAEQALVGVQFRGVAQSPQPLIVTNASHWMWTGAGVANGDVIAGLVKGRIDAIDPSGGRPNGRRSALATSPFRVAGSGAEAVHTTAVCELPGGAVVFASGTESWSLGLVDDQMVDERIRQATRNVLDRIAMSTATPKSAAIVWQARDVLDHLRRGVRLRSRWRALRGRRRPAVNR